MTSDQFVFWLQGFAEMTDEGPNQKQWLMIKDHLALVFNKVTPNRNAQPVEITDLLKRPLKAEDLSTVRIC